LGVALACCAALACPINAAAPPPAGQPGEKGVAFSMKNKPWAGVFRWVQEKTGKPVVCVVKPPGTFSFESPKGVKYTVPEAIDIINEALLAHKLYLLGRPRNYIVVPTDDDHFGKILHLSPDDLEDYVKWVPNKVVSVTFQLNKASPRRSPARWRR
jgi:hypothetical protein